MTNVVGFFSFFMLNLLFINSLQWKNKEWEDFKVKHNKLYKDTFEELKKMENYFKNKKAIESHNLFGRNKFILDMNSFGDVVFEELEKMMKNLMGYKSTGLIPNITMDYFKNLSANTPNSIDWRDYGVVTPVKNQGNCGACWAFSATGSLEGQHALKTGNLVSLSEQNLIDCNHNLINDGCDGGNMDNAFEYVVENDGIDTEESYPYYGHDGYCQYSNNSIGSTANGLRNLPSGNEEILKDVVGNVGPVSVAIDAKGFLFQFYRSGVFYNPFCSSTNLDHGVLVVGYGTSKDGEDYWIVKNSWGPQWGDNGYIYMARNKNNNCGIATSASYPTMANST